MAFYPRDGGRNLPDPHAPADLDPWEDQESFCEVVFILCSVRMPDGHDVPCRVPRDAACFGSRPWRFGCNRTRSQGQGTRHGGRRRQCHGLPRIPHLMGLTYIDMSVIEKGSSALGLPFS